MPILHMETDLVRGVGYQLQQTSSTLHQESQQLTASVQNLIHAWQGNSATIFVGEIQPLLQQLSQFADASELFNQRLQREVNEWERIGFGLGHELASTGSFGSVPGAEAVSSGSVLGAADFAEETKNDTSLMDWFDGIYETIEGIVSKIAPHATVTEWMSGFGTALKGIDLVTSSNEVAAANEAWREAMNQYGTDAPETLVVRYEYSDAELSQVIPGPLKLILKQFGAWDDLIHSFEGAKYEGTHDLFNPPKAQ